MIQLIRFGKRHFYYFIIRVIEKDSLNVMAFCTHKKMKLEKKKNESERNQVYGGLEGKLIHRVFDTYARFQTDLNSNNIHSPHLKEYFLFSRKIVFQELLFVFDVY